MDQEMKKESYLEKLAEKLLDLDKKIDEVKARGKTASADAQRDLNVIMQNLKVKRDEINESMNKIGQSSDEGWTEFKIGAEKAYEELKTGFKNALAKFK